LSWTAIISPRNLVWLLRLTQLQSYSVLGGPMIRRAGITLLFAILGIASLLLFDTIDARFCEIFPLLQHCRVGLNECGLDCSQSWSLSKQVGAFLFFFGPSIIFGVSGFLFSNRPRPALAWSALLAGLVAAHSLVMVVVIQATTR
ncbi:hypothetical protein ACNRBS_10880, partial [Ralstonia pseudosolanacearum]|uniref:hypothetical protein n=2 Tax=Ralstonia pseudosolanacearum TaxID=1310165 RepID=UPI003AAA33D5